MAEAGQPTGQVQIGLDATQFRAGTQAILADIRSIMQGLANFERAASKTGGSLRGIEDASRSLKSFRSVVDGDALPALRRLQNQATASANSLSKVFQVGSQPNQAVAGINRVTTALAAQERQALRTADAMARAATASNRGAMAFRNGGRTSSGTSGRSVAGSTRGARSSLDDSGAAARRLNQKADALFARVGKLATGKSTRPMMPFQENLNVRYARKGSLTPKISSETRQLLRKADQLRESRSHKNYSGYTDERISGTASLEDAAQLFARALARSTAAGVRIRGASPQSARGRRVALQGDTLLDEMMSAIRSGRRTQRPMAFRMSRNQRRLQLVEAALLEQLDSAGLGRRMPNSDIPLLRGGWVADAPNPYRRSSIPRLRKMRRITVGAYSAGQSMDPRETGYLGALSGVGAPGVGAAMLAHEIKRRGRAGKSLPLKAVADALPLYLRGGFRRGPSGKVRMSSAAAERTQTLGTLTDLAMSGADAKKLTKLIRARLRAEEEALGLPAGSVKFAKKGMLSGLASMQLDKAAKRRASVRSQNDSTPSPGTAKIGDASKRLARSLVRSAAAGVVTREYGGRTGRGGMSVRQHEDVVKYAKFMQALRSYGYVSGGGPTSLPINNRSRRSGMTGDYYKFKPVAGFDPRTIDNRSSMGMMTHAMSQMIYGQPGRIALAPNPYYKKPGYPRALTQLRMMPVGAYSSSTNADTHGYIGGLAGTAANWSGAKAPLGGVGGTLIAGELRRRDRYRRDLPPQERRSMTRIGSRMSPYGGFGQLEMYGIGAALPAYQGMGAEEKLATGRTKPYRRGEDIGEQDGHLAFTPWRTKSIIRGIRRSLPGQIAALREIGGDAIPSNVRFNRRGSLVPNERGRQAILSAESLRQEIVRATEIGREEVPVTASIQDAARMLARGIVHSQIQGVRISRVSADGGGGDFAADAQAILGEITQRHHGRMAGEASPFPFVDSSRGRIGMMGHALRQMHAGERGGFIAHTSNEGIPEALRPIIPFLPVGAYSTREPGQFHGYLGSLSGLGIPGIGSAMFGAEIKRRVAMGRIAAMTSARERFLHPADITEHYREILPYKIPSLDISAADSGKGFYALAGMTDTAGRPIGGDVASRVPGSLTMQGPRQLAMVQAIREQIRLLEQEYGLPANSVRFAKRSSLSSVAASAGVRGKGGDSTVGATSKRGFEPLAAAIDTALGTYIKDMLQGLKAGRNGTIGPRQVAKALGQFQEDILSSFGAGSGKGIAGLRSGFDALPADSRRRISKSISSIFGSLLSDYSEQMAPALRRGGAPMRSLTGRGHRADLRQLLVGSQGVLREELASTQAAFVPQRRRTGFAFGAPSASKYSTTPAGSGLEFVNGVPVVGGNIFKSPGVLESIRRSGSGQGHYDNALAAVMLGQQFMPKLPEHYGSMMVGDIQGTLGASAFGVAGMNTARNRRGGKPGGFNKNEFGFGQIMVDPGGAISHTITLFNTVKTALHEIEHVREEAASMRAKKLTGKSSGPEYEAAMKRQGFGSSELLPVYNPNSGELMYVPKGAAKITVTGETAMSTGKIHLPQGAIGKTEYMGLGIKERANYERALITREQASVVDKNAGGSHVDIQRHFIPQARMGAESGFGISQMASLLAFSNQRILPGETQDEANLRSQLTNAGFFSGSQRGVLQVAGARAIRPGLEGTANSYIGGALPAYQQVMKGPQRTAAMFGARVQAGLSQAVQNMSAGGDQMSLLGGAAKALVKATEAIPAKELKATFGSLSKTALVDFGMVLDAAVRGGRQLTQAVPLGQDAAAADSFEFGNPQQQQRRRRKKAADVPVATTDASGRTVSALTPQGLQAVSAATHALTLSTAGVSAGALPQARANVRQARTGVLGLPERPTADLAAVQRNLALATIAAEVGAMKEGPHKEALKGMLQPYMPNNPLFDLPKGTRTGRGRNAGVIAPSTSRQTGLTVPQADLTYDQHLARIQQAIFAESFGSRVRGGPPRPANMPGGNVLGDPEAYKMLGITPNLRETLGLYKDYIANTKMAKTLTNEWQVALAKASTGSLNLGKTLQSVSDSSKGLLFTVKDTIKFATAITLTQNAAGAISQGIGHVTGGFIQFNSILEQSRVGFTTLFKQGGDSMGIAESRAAGMIERMKEFANVTPFRFAQLEEAAIRMKAFGLELGNIIRRDSSGQLVGYMRSIGDAVAALGGGDEKIMRITYALGQMNSAGRVYQNDMMQLANAGIAGYEILAEKLIQELEAKGENMTEEDKKILNDMYNNRIEAIRRLTSKGAISGKGAVQAIMAGLGERYGGGMDRLSKTMAGAFSTIADMSQSLVATMTGPVYEAIRDIVVQLATYLQSNEVLKYFMKLRDGMVGFANDIRAAIPAAAKIAGNALSYMVNLFKSMFSGQGSIAGGVDTLKNGLKTLADLLSNDVVKAMAMSAIAAKLLMSAITSNPLIVAVTGIIAGLGIMRQAYETNFMGIKDTIDGIAPSFSDLADVIATTVVPAIKGFIEGASLFLTGALSAAIKVIGPIVGGLANSFGVVGRVLEAFAPILGFVITALFTKSLVVNTFALAFTKLSTAITGAAGAMAQFALQSKYIGSRSAVGVGYGMMSVDPKTGMPIQGTGAEGQVGAGPRSVIRTPGLLRGVTYASQYGAVPMPGGAVQRDLQGNVIAAEMMHGVTARTTVGSTIDPSMLLSPELRDIKKTREAMLRAGLIGIMPTESDVEREGGLMAARRAGQGEVGIRGKGRKAIVKEVRAARKIEAARRGVSVAALTMALNTATEEELAAVPRNLLMPEQVSPEENLARLTDISKRTSPELKTLRDHIQAARAARGLSTDVSPVGKYEQRTAAAPVRGVRATGMLPTPDAFAMNVIPGLKDLIPTDVRERVGRRVNKVRESAASMREGFTAWFKEQSLGGGQPMTQIAANVGGMATAVGAATTALGGLAGIIDTNLGATISQLGITMLGFGSMVVMTTQALAAMGGTAGIKAALSSLTSTLMGPMGIVGIFAAFAFTIMAVNSDIERRLKETAETIKNFNDTAKATARSTSEKIDWKQNKPAFGGGSMYEVRGMTDAGLSLDQNLTETELQKLVDQGLFEKVDNPLVSSGYGDYTYKPTAAGYKAGYSAAEVQTNTQYFPGPKQVSKDSAAYQKFILDANGILSASSEEEKKLAESLFLAGSFDPEKLAEDQRAAAKAILDNWVATTGASVGEIKNNPIYRDEISASNKKILNEALAPARATETQILAQRGYSGAYLGDYGKPGLIDESIFDVSGKIKLLNDNLEDAQKAADEAAKRLNELFDPFATAFQQFMERAMKVVQEQFKAEQDQLAAEQSDALANVIAIKDGEEVRLGVLEEQYSVLQEQRKEQERINALGAAQENAARATLGLFDAQADPIQAAIAAREAGQALAKEEQNYAMDSLATSIEKAKNSTEYAKVDEYYAQRKRQLDEDQEERQRQIQERAQQLLKDIKEGKITPKKAQEEFFNMFGDVGIDMENIIATGTLGGEALAETFGTAFVEKFQSLADLVVNTIDDVVRAGISAAVSATNVEGIIADLDKLAKAEDKIRGDKIAKERDRMKQVIRDSQAVLAIKAKEYLLTGDITSYAKTQTYLQSLESAYTTLSGLNIDKNKIYTRADFNATFENVYKQFAAMYDDLGAFQDIRYNERRGGQARGGQIGAGQYIVGERGPEMLQMYPGGGGQVIPNHKLPASMRSSYGALKAGNGLGYQGRAGGGYVSPFGDEDRFFSPSDSFNNSLNFLNDPAGFQQQSFNDFMRDPNNTRAMKNALAQRYPKNYAAYVRSQISGGAGGRFGFGRVRGRALGGALPMDSGVEIPTDPTDPEFPPVEPPVVVPPVPPTCPIGTVPRWDPVAGQWTCVPADWMWPEFGTPELPLPRWLLFDARAHMLANNEMPWGNDKGNWSRIKGAVVRAYAPFGAGKGGNPDILDNSGYHFGSQAVTKGGPAFGGQQSAVVAGGTGWQKRWGWLSKVPGLGKFSPLSTIFNEDIRPLDWLKKGQLGTMLRVGQPSNSVPGKAAKNRFIPTGMNRPGILGRLLGTSGNLMDRRAVKAYPFLKYGSMALAALFTYMDWQNEQKMGADFWQTELNRIQTENTISDWWKNNRQNYVPWNILPLGGTPLGDFLDEGYKKPAVESAIKAGKIKFPAPITLNEEERAYFEASKEPLGRFAMRTGGAAIGGVLAGALTAMLGAASGGLGFLATTLIGGLGTGAGNLVGGTLYDLLMGTNTPYHQVRGMGNPNDKGLLATMGDAGRGIREFIDSISNLAGGKKYPSGAKVSYKQGLFDPVLLSQLSTEKATQLYGMIEDYRPSDVKLPTPPGGYIRSNAALLTQGYTKRWYKEEYQPAIPGVREAMKFIQLLPTDWRPSSKYPGKFTPAARAFGGSIAQNMPYLVGERGPELMIPNNSGYMLPNTGLRALQAPGDLRAAGGGATINASVTINNPVVSDAADIDKLAEKVSTAQVRTLRAAGFMRPS